MPITAVFMATPLSMQIVGGSLRDEKNQAKENFVSDQDGAFFAEFYKKDGLKGGHIILLNPADSAYYEADKAQAALALAADPGGLMVGGGVCAENAWEFLDLGASHVIVTSYVFKDGRLNEKIWSGWCGPWAGSG